VVVVALTIVAKLFLWPLWFWLVATKRWTTAAAVAGAAAVSVVGGWALIGFAGVREYPDLLARLASLVQGDGYSPVALGLSLGASPNAARVASLVLGGLLMVALFVVARRDDGDRRAFTLAVVASLVFSPIVWLHYLALLIVPIAIRTPTFSALWVVPTAFCVAGVSSGGDASTIAIVWLVAILLVLWTLLAPAPRSRIPVRP